MSLREKAAAKAAELAAQKEQTAAEEREVQLKPVRDQIAELESKRKKLQTDLESFGAAEKASGEALGEFKKDKKPIDQIYAEHEAEPEITGGSKEAFIRSNEEESEVKSFRAAGKKLRQDVSSLRTARQSAQAEMGDQTLVPQKTKGERKKGQARAEVKNTITTEIAKLDAQIAELRLQTPEGQAELQSKRRQEVLERRRNFAPSIETLEDIGRESLVFGPDLELGEKYGDDFVKSVVKEGVAAQIDVQAKKRRDSEHLDEVARDINRLEQLDTRAGQFQAALGRMINAREELVGVISEALQNNQQFRQKADITSQYRDTFSYPESNSYRYSVSQLIGKSVPNRLLEFIQTAGRYNNLYANGAGEAVLGHELELKAREAFGKADTYLGHSSNLPYKSDIRHGGVPDFEGMAMIADGLTTVFNNIQAEVVRDPNALFEIKEKFKELGAEAIDKDMTGGSYRFSHYLDKETLKLVGRVEGRASVSYMDKENIRNTIKATAGKAESLKQLAAAKIDSEWAGHRFQQFQSKNRAAFDLDQQEQSTERAKEQIPRLSQQLGEFQVALGQYLREEFTFTPLESDHGTPYRIRHVANAERSNNLSLAIDKRAQEIKDAQKEVDQAVDEFRGAGIFKRGKAEKKLEEARTKLDNLQKLQQKDESDKRQAGIFDDKVYDTRVRQQRFYEWLSSLQIGSGLPQGKMQLAEFFTRLEHRISTLDKFELTADQRAIHAQYVAMKEAVTTMKKKFEDLRSEKIKERVSLSLAIPR